MQGLQKTRGWGGMEVTRFHLFTSIECEFENLFCKTFPTTRTKFSAGKNVLRMFERLEQREMENKKLLKEEESKIIQSRRCPLKANTDHRFGNEVFL